MSKTIQEQIEVMQHYANGGEVEFKHLQGNKEEWQLKTNITIGFDWSDKDYRIKEQKKTIIIEKWLVFLPDEDEYKVIETSNIKSYEATLYKVIKLLDAYKVEL